LGYLAGGSLALILLLACVGFVYEQIAEYRDRRLNHPPGQLVDVGGYRMHLYCTGQGSPTVILDSGLGDYWLSWHNVQPQISQFTRVCSYDRAGLGWSDPSPLSRTSKTFAQELHTLLQRASVPAPYVLVGHSLGGMNVRMYAGLYPAEVAGMILVDSGFPHQEQRLPPWVNELMASYYRKIDMQGLTMPLGIPRLMDWCGTDPPEFRSMVRAIECRRQFFREGHEEWAKINEDVDQVQAVVSLGNMPLVVLSRDPDKFVPGIPPDLAMDGEKAWEAMQQELTRLSTNSSLIVAKGSGHYIPIERPDVVIEAVQNVVGRCRAAQQPAPQS
jgi:pimeloyl-ACP methyl ester carboxylesterase